MRADFVAVVFVVVFVAVVRTVTVDVVVLDVDGVCNRREKNIHFSLLIKCRVKRNQQNEEF